MDLGLATLLLMVGFAYGFGVLWYDLLPGELAMHPWRVAAYPFIAIVIAEGLLVLAPNLGGPRVGEMHVFPAVIATLIGVIIDWVLITVRHPTSVQLPEPLAARS